MSPEAQAAHCEAPASHCITCSDEGTPMRVLRGGRELAECRDEGGGLHQVAVDLIAPLDAGETVLVHAGVAIGRVAG